MTTILKLLSLLFPLALGQVIYVPPMPQIISTFTISCGVSCSFPGGTSPSGTVIGTYSETMLPPSPGFSGSLSLSTTGPCAGLGAGNANFQIVSGVLETAVTNLATGSYAVCALASEGGGVTNSPVALATTIAGTNAIASTSISCGASCSFTVGTASTVGSLAAVMNPTTPAFTGSWSLRTTGTVSGQTCDNSGFFSISGNNLNVSSSATAGTYQVCYVATQAGAGGSPFPNVVAITGSGGALAGFVMAPTTASPPGNDSNPGTLAAPFATLQKCQTAMRGATAANKVCNIRAGTYTAGSGYTTQNLTGGDQASLLLTSADNGSAGNPATYTEYAPDIPSNAVSTAIFDGGAAAWSAPNGSASCPVGNPPLSALTDGIWIVGASYVTIDHLMFRNYCWTGIMIQGGWSGNGNWTTDCELINNGTTADHVVISNNVVHDITDHLSCSNGGLQGYRAGITGRFANTNTTVTHNLVYNVTGKAIDNVMNPCSAGDGSQTNNGLSVDHNLIYNANAALANAFNGSSDSGVIYMWDCNQQTSAIKTLSYNYIMSFGSTAGGIPGNNGFYDDSGVSGMTRMGNVVKGPGQECFSTYATNLETDFGNICDVGDVSSNFIVGIYMGAAGPCPASAFPYPCVQPYNETYNRNLTIGNTPNTSACPGGGDCTVFVNWYVVANPGAPNYPGVGSNNNDYYNYGTAGSTVFQSQAQAACCGTGSSDTNAQAIAPSFSCPGGAVDSWSYKLLATSPLFSAPTNFPAQPAGWGTPGFWGPQLSTWTPTNSQGYSIGTNHFGSTPSYIGSGVNGC